MFAFNFKSEVVHKSKSRTLWSTLECRIHLFILQLKLYITPFYFCVTKILHLICEIIVCIMTFSTTKAVLSLKDVISRSKQANEEHSNSQPETTLDRIEIPFNVVDCSRVFGNVSKKKANFSSRKMRQAVTIEIFFALRLL